MQGCMEGFAKFDPAARQRIKTLGWRSRAAHQQDLAIAKDRGTDGQLGMGRLHVGRQGMIPAEGPRQRKVGTGFRKEIMPDR
jgi:hypothetical protein